ncbi:restriction endonuclease subunit S [Vibrio fluvialis]|uniref:restriction endonuclease subunit S n=1 Tax=Vibrio fluvialis TaxID=676 RepID=UPI002ACAED10|nr:restriction endonuclease subunit S [Vibrio fluvialis]MDZ5516593.1 restriction endonuclease subunit S [Vibrio fluvialis]
MSNLVPEGWSLRNLGSTLDVLIAGQSPNRKEFPARPSEYGILKTTAIDWGRFYPQHNQEVLDDFKPNLKHEVAVDDILITKAGPAHRVGVVAHVKSTPSKILVSGKMTLMRVKQDYVSSFIAYALSTEYSQKPLKESTTGMASSQTNFTHDTLKEIPIFVPSSKNEQKKIAAILTSVDYLIEKTQAQIDKLKDLKTGMMQELLTRGVGVDGKPYTEFKDSPVGRIPKGWGVLPLANVVERVIDCEHKTAPYVEKSEFMVVRTSNVRSGELLFEDMKFTHSEGYSEWTKRAVPSVGDVLFTREAPAGESCLVPEGLKICMGQRMVLLRPNRELVHPCFFSMFLTSEAASKSIYELSIGTTVSRINIEDIKRIPCMLPPLDEQLKISRSIQSVQRVLDTKQRKLLSLQNNKKALMQDLLTGKVRVKVDS